MKIVLQRVQRASVSVDGQVIGKIDKGFLLLTGISHTDDEKIADKMMDKICRLRIFEDDQGKTNLSLSDVGGQMLVISQFTLFADCRSRRPGFTGAARPDVAIPLYERFMAQCEARGFHVEHGEFGADMQVFSQNDGPVTIWLDTEVL